MCSQAAAEQIINFLQCHTHPKIKDAPKRRRESSHSRALAASTMAKPQMEPPATPQAPRDPPSNASMAARSQARKRISPLESLSNMI